MQRKKVIDKIGNLSLLYSKKRKERFMFLINLLNEYGIHQNKSIYLQAFEASNNYYVNHLISLISKIDFILVDSYMRPNVGMSSQLKSRKIDGKAFIDAIEILRKSKITISSQELLEEGNYLSYVFDLDHDNPYDVIMIDNFDKFIREANEDFETIINHIKKFINRFHCEVVLFIGEKDLKKYKFNNIGKANLEENIRFIYDESNYEIKDIIGKR